MKILASFTLLRVYTSVLFTLRILHVMATYGLLPTPNSPRLNSTNPNDFVKPSLFPLPYQAVHIIESLEINSPPTWLINVKKNSVNFKIEWDVLGKSTSVTSVFPKPVIHSLSTFDAHDPVWSTSLNNKKICLKIEWKIKDSSQSTSQLNPNSPCYSSKPFASSPMTPHPPNNDSGYYSSPSPFTPQKASGYSHPQSPFFPTTLFTPHRQDVYISPTKQKPQHSHKVGINKSSTYYKPVVKSPPETTPTIDSPSLVPMSPIIPDGPSPSTQPVITPRPKSQPIDHAPPITTNHSDNQLASSSSHENSNFATNIVPPVAPQPNSPVIQTQDVTPPLSENTAVLNSPPIVVPVDPTNTSTISPVPVESSPPDDHPTSYSISATPIAPPVIPQPNLPVIQSQAVTNPSPDNTAVLNSPPIVASGNPTNTITISPGPVESSSPGDDPSSYPLPKPYTPPNQNASLQPNKSKKNKHGKKKFNQGYVGSTSKDQSPSPLHFPTMIPTDHKFLVHEESTDDDIQLIPHPDAHSFDNSFMKTPDDLRVDDRGLLDPSVKAIWMNLQG